MNETKIITIKDVATGTVIAQATLDDGVILEDNAYYFLPEKVNMQHLLLTERIYTCPYKGVCNWIDLPGTVGTIEEVAWVYPEPKADYAQIAGRIGFYTRSFRGTMVEITTQPQIVES